MDDLDRILAGESGIEPSSGFAETVMDAVRAEAARPAPIPFPWRRLLPGLALSCVLLVAAAILGTTAGTPILRLPPIDPVTIAREAAASGISWALIALAGSWLVVRLAVRRAA